MRTRILLVIGILHFNSLFAQKETTRILIFGSQGGYSQFINQLSSKFRVDTTSNHNFFTENNLKNYQAVLFINASVNEFSFRESAELQRFIKAGGGFVGIGNAAQKNYKWLWYENMISGKLNESQYENKVQLSLITNATIGKTSVAPLWKIEDKPIMFGNLPVKCKPVLMDLMGKTWAWYFTTEEGGKMFYSAIGVENSTFENSDFRTLIEAAIEEVASKTLPDYTKIAQTALPNDTHFLKIPLIESLQNPISFSILPNENIIVLEQSGVVKMYIAQSRQSKIIGQIDATGIKEIRLDPEFNQNHYVYTFAESANNDYKIGRFETIGDSTIILSDFSAQSTTPIIKKAVYDFGRAENAPYKLPKYFDKKSFRYDDTQGFVVETIDENDEVKNIEPFVPSIKFNFIQDLEFGNDGALYFLENNQLLKVDYSETNRKPIAKASADIISGTIPLKVRFSSSGSIDYDPADGLSYEWNFDGLTTSYEQNPEFIFTKAGDFTVSLKVTDTKKETTETTILIKALPKNVKKK